MGVIQQASRAVFPAGKSANGVFVYTNTLLAAIEYQQTPILRNFLIKHQLSDNKPECDSRYTDLVDLVTRKGDEILENKCIERKYRVMFNIPMILYGLFIVVFLVERFLILSIVTNNAFFDSRSFPRTYNLMPIQTIYFYLSNGKNQVLDVVANVLLFVPLGIYIHAVSNKKKIVASMLVSLLMGLMIETLQYILATGSFDIDDILLNFLGSLFGISICHLAYHLSRKDNMQTNRWIAIVSVMMIPLLILTVVEYGFWLDYSIIAIVSAIVLFASYIGCFWLVRHDGRNTRRFVVIIGVVLSGLYYLVILPMVGHLPITV